MTSLRTLVGIIARMKEIGVGVMLLLAGVLLASEAQAALCFVEDRGPQVEMNTVVVGNLVKTIEVEKFEFPCGDDPNKPTQIRDVQIFTEVIETQEKETFSILAKRFQVITCDEDTRTATLLGCNSSTPPPLTIPIRRADCKDAGSIVNPLHLPIPIAMNTVVVGDLVKTVKAQKELFFCGADLVKADLVSLTTFTEIIEKKAKKGFDIVQKGFELATCRISKIDAVVLGCGISRVPAL